ncbi:7-cyano-7-deazaguanine synthase [archaeon HR06]|nr:7-cyano-7-deazaguanine synthase [archaeon HR06]
MEKALILLSGGIDSATCLWWAKSRNWLVYALSFNYYRRSKREIMSSEILAKEGKVKEHIVIDLPFLKEAFDLKLKVIPSIYIPARNLIFYSIAIYLSEIYEFNYIVGGHNTDDQAIFPDAKSEYFQLLNQIINKTLLTGKEVKIITPLSNLKKFEVVKLGKELGVPFEYTWSCHRDYLLPCKECEGCKSREEAFKRAGIKDPLEDTSHTSLQL